MNCDCATLKTEILSQRKLMVEYFEMLMTELQDVKYEINTKFNSINIGEQCSPPAQPFTSNILANEPFSSSVLLESDRKNFKNYDFDKSDSSSNQPTTKSEPNTTPALSQAPDPTIDYTNTAEFVLLEGEDEPEPYLTLVPTTSKSYLRSKPQNLKTKKTQKTPPPPSCSKKRFSCDMCPYRSSANIDMRRHRRTHTGEKPFACDQCPYITSRMYSLRKHKMTHSNDKPFKCNNCGYQTFHKRSLVSHKKRRHGLVEIL